MHFIYTLSCPLDNNVKYIGQTTNIKIRYVGHLCDNKSKEKFDWIQELKQKNLKPKLNVLEVVENKDEALKKESELIRLSLKDGAKLFNSNYQKAYYKFDLKGELIDVIITVRGQKSNVKMNRHTHNGFVYNTENIFPQWKLDSKFEGLSKQKKIVYQYTKNGIFVNEFFGVREACRITGIDHRSISQVAGNSIVRKSAGGYLWMYNKKLI
jgi:predicted GIY-YIG superfamily endonuclease